MFYHPKNHLNLHDAAYITYSIGSVLYVVPRSKVEYKLEILPEKIRNRIRIIGSIDEVTRYEPDSFYIVLETYGIRYLSEVRIPYDRNVVLIIGAEDYGVPRDELSTLPHHVVAKLPVSVEGMSYNVVASLVMALYELKRKQIE